MDMRKYSSAVIRPEDLHSGARVEKIINVFEHEKHNCAVLEFESGDQLFLWNNLARVLNRAWGYNSEDWLGLEVEVSLGHYTDKRDNPPTEKECVNIRAVSPAPGASGSAPKPALSNARDMDDNIPF
jgi:hypothetical protein